jgi:hypothetical protein
MRLSASASHGERDFGTFLQRWNTSVAQKKKKKIRKGRLQIVEHMQVVAEAYFECDERK